MRHISLNACAQTLSFQHLPNYKTIDTRHTTALSRRTTFVVSIHRLENSLIYICYYDYNNRYKNKMIFFEIYKIPNVRNRIKIKKPYTQRLFVSQGTPPLVSGAFSLSERKFSQKLVALWVKDNHPVKLLNRILEAVQIVSWSTTPIEVDFGSRERRYSGLTVRLERRTLTLPKIIPKIISIFDTEVQM